MNTLSEQLGTLSGNFVNFAISTLLYAVIIALFTLSTYEFGLRGIINKALLGSWLSRKSTHTESSLSGRSLSLRRFLWFPRIDPALQGMLDLNNFYQLSYRQLCAQIFAKIEWAIHSNGPDLYKLHQYFDIDVPMSYDEEAKDKAVSENIALSSAERSVDNLQAYMYIWTVRMNYILSTFFALAIGWASVEIAQKSNHAVLLICFVAGIIAPVGQRLIEQWLSTR